MTPEEARAAREKLGEMWGVGRGLTPIEMARALGLSPTNGNDHILNMERGKSKVSGPIDLLIRHYLSGRIVPLDDQEIFKSNSKTRRNSETGAMKVNPLRNEAAEVPDNAITAEEAADRMGIAARSLGTMRSQGRGPKFWKVGANVYYLPDDVESYLAGPSRRRVLSPAASPSADGDA